MHIHPRGHKPLNEPLGIQSPAGAGDGCNDFHEHEMIRWNRRGEKEELSL